MNMSVTTSRKRSSLAAAGLVFALAMTTQPAQAAPCAEPRLEHVSSTDAECRFFAGTRHYRAKEYAAALQEWQAIIDSRDMPIEQEYLRAHAQNNAGYLYFSGWGVKQDSGRAIRDYWIPAFKTGHEEAAYHLCHVYADDHAHLALSHCREALRRYENMRKPEGDEGPVIEDLRRYIKRLEQNNGRRAR